MVNVRRGVALSLLGVGLVVPSCGVDRAGVPLEVDASATGLRPASGEPALSARLPESAAVARRVDELRTRFRLPSLASGRARLGQPSLPSTRPALGEPVVARFEADAGSHVRAVVSAEARAGVSRPARVELPMRASGEVRLEDERSRLSVRFALENVQDAPVEVSGGVALYRGAVEGADLVHRVHAEGTEDFVVFETRPSREELRYSVDVARVPGLRLVSNTFELLDETGTPALRVAPPYVVDAKGERHEARLAVDGCAYDTSPVGPWGRPVTRPGAGRCTVRVGWGGGAVSYPAMVDPAWGATGSMATPRAVHTASVLGSGKVLVAGGSNSVTGIASAELFDLAGNAGNGTFAATGSMLEARGEHTASVLASGKVLVAGGVRVVGPTRTYHATAEVYDPAAGTFAATGGMATGRFTHAATVLASGKVLVTGGKTATSTTSSAEVYDPAGNGGIGAFAPTGAMMTTRHFHTASLLPSGKVLVAGGSGGVQGATSASCELYDPVANGGAGAFGPTASMSVARYLHTASVLPSGKVLVAGGAFESTFHATAEVYDPAGGFARTGGMTTGRNGHSATVLPSGKVLVAGGLAAPSSAILGAELYDPALSGGVFTTLPRMAQARVDHTATLLPQGLVLIAGGGTDNLAAAELLRGTSGDECTSNAACVSGFCADGFCCDTACSGACDRCDVSGAKGTCTVLPAGVTGSGSCAYACDGVSASCPSSCTSSAGCAKGFSCANGACVPGVPGTACTCKPGEPCNECESGFCVDRVCCKTACNGTCQACAAAEKSSGVDDGTCDTAKDGQRGDVFCGPGATCENDHTSKDGAGNKQECAPYKCVSNACGKTCASVNDCVSPAICDSSGRCVPPTAAPKPEEGGCAVAPALRGRASDALALSWIVLGLGIVGIRRMRRCRVVSHE